MTSSTSSYCHNSIFAYKGKDEHDLMVPEWIGSTFHTCRANSNGGVLPRMIIGPNGSQMVALINSFLEPSDSYHGEDARRLLQERDEARALYSNVVRDLGQMDFHLNAM